MDDIRIYDFEFNLLHIEHDVPSSNWTIYHNDIGTWEGHFDLSSDIVPVIMNNPYLVAVQGSKQAIITGINDTKDFALFGRTPNWLLSKFPIAGFDVANLSLTSKDVESICRWVILQAFSGVSNFVLGDKVGFTTEQSFVRTGYNYAFDVIKECLDLDSAGHKVIFDTSNKRWVFQVTKGSVLPLIVSEANLNAYETEYTENLLEYFSGGWYQPDGSEAWSRIEGDSAKTGIYKWDAVLSGSTESEAAADLAKKKWEKAIATKVKDLQYGVDYNLGDTVKVQKQIGSFRKTFSKRITGVNLWYENNNIGEQPILEE